MPAATPALSVVTPTHRRADLLERLLHSLRRQTVAPERFEVVVVDDGSADETPATLQRAETLMRNLRWRSSQRGRGPAAARNEGVRLARGRLILFLDDDIEATPDLVETHLRLHDEAGDPSLGILGRVDWHSDLEITPFMRWLDRSGLQFAYDTWLRPGHIDPPYAAFYTANLSVHRDLVVRSGGFDERFPYAAYEDMELAWRLHRLGFRMDYRPEAQALHTRGIDLPAFARRMARAAESAVLLGAVQPDFPLSPNDTPERWPVPGALTRRRRAIRARFTQNDARLDRHYRGEIALAYQQGLKRGRELVAERARVSTSPAQ
jgi:GT2 family glycosyltransferase